MESGANEVTMHDESGSSGAMIEIKIKTMDSQTYSLRVDKQMPVPALKEQIASVTGVVTEHQRLICRGKVLKDDQLLSAYHVEDGHTLHLVVREPASTSSENLSVDPALDRPSAGSRGQFFQVAPGIVVETFNMPGQGDRALPDISRIISAVLGSFGVTGTGIGGEGSVGRDQNADRPAGTPATDLPQTQTEQSGSRGQNDSSSLQSLFGIPGAVPSGSLQAPVIPDAITTLSQYLSHMRQEFISNGRTNENINGASAMSGTEGGYSTPDQSESVQERLPSPASLAELLTSTRRLLNHQTEECLLQLTRDLESQGDMIDQAARASAQSGALRTGVLLQNLGAYFLELGRTVTTLRLGRSPLEAVVNAGPAVYISPTGPNPLMVQPLPFQPGASFSSPVPGTSQPGSGLFNGLGAGFVPRRIDIQIRRVGPSSHQAEPAGSQPPSGQRNSLTNVSGDTPNNQPVSGTTDASSLNNGAAVRVLPLRSTTATVPDLNRLPTESRGGIGLLYPFLGRFLNLASGGLSSRNDTVSGENQSTSIQTEPHTTSDSASIQQNADDSAGNEQAPPSSFGQREAGASRTIDINILSTGGIQSDEIPEGEIPSGILQLLRGLFPNGEFQVESVNSQGPTTGSDLEQERSTEAQETEPRATDEGVFLSRMLQQIMPIISQEAGADHNVVHSGGVDSQHRDDSSSSMPAEDSEAGTSRRRGDLDSGPIPKRQKME